VIVADSSAIVKYLAREPGWEKARSLLAAGNVYTV
jgi:predicted nucleic acid-binding protein